jgi:hypothetical protein
MTEFQVGSYVLAKYHSTAGVVQHRGPPNKLLSHLRGPFKVVRHDKDSNTYIIQSLITNRIVVMKEAAAQSQEAVPDSISSAVSTEHFATVLRKAGRR